jgi:proteic killer suppression protein
MIRSIRHKGLKRLHEHDDPRGVIWDHASKLRDILARLDAAATVADMDLPGFRLHALKGGLKGFWAVTVTRQLAGDLSLCRQRCGGC